MTCNGIQFFAASMWGLATVLMLIVVFRSLWSRVLNDNLRRNLAGALRAVWRRKSS